MSLFSRSARRYSGSQLLVEQLETRHVLSGVPLLNSFPAAPASIFLDFDGHHEDRWGTYRQIDTPAFSLDDDASFSADEVAMITEIWQRVGEAYSPFNLNVTTVDPHTNEAFKSVTVAIGGSNSDWLNVGYGGIAEMNSFRGFMRRVNTAFVFTQDLDQDARSIADAASHEAGHALGLDHQARYANGMVMEEYHTGEVDAGPIMGTPRHSARSIWWYGSSIASEQSTQDDLYVVGSRENRFGLREDGIGHMLEQATPWGDLKHAAARGVIVRPTLADFFSFTTAGGPVKIEVRVAAVGPTLDAKLELLDEGGKVVRAADPADSLGAVLDLPNLRSGKYFVRVASHGKYWGDVGTYTIAARTGAEEPLPVREASLRAVANTLTHSAESFGNFVKDAYRLYLGRQPDAVGLAHWVAQMQQGMTDERLEAVFIGSAEYIAGHGGTGAKWVEGMYRDLFDRDADEPGKRYFLERLGKGVAPQDVAYAFAASAEREGMRVAAEYRTYLGRELDDAGRDYWVGVFLQGARNEDVVAGFVGSAEYFDTVQKGMGDRSTWLSSAFLDILRRTPTSSEIDQFMEQLG